jgi:hypothetical protein
MKYKFPHEIVQIKKWIEKNSSNEDVSNMILETYPNPIDIMREVVFFTHLHSKSDFVPKYYKRSCQIFNLISQKVRKIRL